MRDDYTTTYHRSQRLPSSKVITKMTNGGWRMADGGLKHQVRALVVLPMRVQMAIRSLTSYKSQCWSVSMPRADSSLSSSQYCVSAASFSTRAILWVKSLRDSARFASR